MCSKYFCQTESRCPEWKFVLFIMCDGARCMLKDMHMPREPETKLWINYIIQFHEIYAA